MLAELCGGEVFSVGGWPPAEHRASYFRTRRPAYSRIDAALTTHGWIMPRSSSSKLALVGGQSATDPLQPPPHLAGVGLVLWRAIASQYCFEDPASYEMLAQACFAVNRAERCRVIIDRDGELLHVGRVPRAHPLIREETQTRALASRLLQRLGLDLEAAASQRVPHPHGR
jgi:hypothetical protein